MCGIAGVLGRKGAPRIVRDALRSLEYRGYDSCGVAWLEDGVRVAKAVGAVENLDVPASDASIALGHTRWATHGGVTVANAHPHLDGPERVAVVHNGVLLNHEALRAQLTADGAVFRSETDSENLAHLWGSHKDEDAWTRMARLRDALQGTFSMALLDADEQAVFIAKHRNPLWLAKTDDAVFLASDAVALRRHATRAVPLEDGDHGRVTQDGWEIRDAFGNAVERDEVDIQHIDDRMDKAGYEHYMLKEIHETPSALNRLLAAHVRPGEGHVDLGLPRQFLDDFRRALMLGAGTSFHAGLLGALYMQRIAGIPAQARPTPEYKDEPDVPEPDTLLVALTQSGETLDTLQAMMRLQSHPHASLAFTNHPTSTIGRQADHTVALQSGIEVSVAATKTFLSQSMLLYLLALEKAAADHAIGEGHLDHATRELLVLPRAIERTLRRVEPVMEAARELALYDNMFLLAKGLLLPAALEGALKLKEIAYQHAEAYPAGELKHGPFALLTAKTPVVFLLAPGPSADAVRNSMQEVHARGAPVFALVMEGTQPGPADHVIMLPHVDPDLAPFVFASALHHLSYWVAKARGLPIDKPRNLAKSVTVE